MTLNHLFSRHYFMTQFKRYLPATVLYTLVVFLAVPLVLLVDSSKPYKYRSFVAIIIANPVMFYLLLIVPALLGLIYHYMFNVKYINHIYTLPLTRLQLYLTNLLVGYCLLAAPLLFNYSLVALLKLTVGPKFLPAIVGYGDIMQLMIHYLFISWIVFTLSSCVAMVCSSIFVHVVLIASLIVVPPIIALLLDGTLHYFLYGYPGNTRPLTSYIIEYCPAYWLSILVVPSGDYSSFKQSAFDFRYHYLFYAIPIFVLCLTVAIHHNKQRHMENLHKWVSFKWVINVLKFLACLLGSVTSTFFVLVIGFPFSSLLFVITGIIGGLIGHIIINIFIEKKLNILNTWKFYASYSAFIVLTFIVIYFNWTGYKNYFPQEDEIDSIYIDCPSYFLGVYKYDDISVTTTDDIEVVKQIQKFYLDRPEYQRLNINFEETEASYYTRLTFNLKNGKTIKRSYALHLPSNIKNKEDLSTSYYQLLYKLNPIRQPSYELPPEGNTDIKEWAMVLRGEKSDIDDLSSLTVEKIKQSLIDEYSTMTFEQRKLHAKSRSISFELNVNIPSSATIFLSSEFNPGRKGYHQTLYISEYTPATLALIKDYGYYDQLLYNADDFKWLTIYKKFNDNSSRERIKEVTDNDEIFDLYLNTKDDYYSNNSDATFYYQFIFTTVMDKRIYKETLDY